MLAAMCLAGAVHASGNGELPPPGTKDKCPVCGMFVYKYPDWVAYVEMNDGHMFYFDGAKDMFRFFFDMDEFGQGRDVSEIKAMHVTDYYDLVPVAADKAYYVIGSDVYGPMGRELVPFASFEGAREFMLDHKGKGVLEFKDIDNDIVRGLDR